MLVKDLHCIMHEEQLSYLSGSSEEDLIYHSATPVGSFEIGYGSMLLRSSNSKSVEEDSEANSVPADNKSYLTSESYSGTASFVVHSESKGASNSNASPEKPKWFPVHTHEIAKRYSTPLLVVLCIGFLYRYYMIMLSTVLHSISQRSYCGENQEAKVFFIPLLQG